MRIRRLAISSLTVLTLVLGACGGGDDDDGDAADASDRSSTTSSTAAETTTSTVAAAEATSTTVAASPGTTAAAAPADGTLTKAEYIAAGDSLCQRFVDASKDLPTPLTPQQVKNQIDYLLPLADQIIAEFVALLPPPEGAEVHASLRSALERSIARVRDARAALDRNDFAAAQQAGEEAVAIAKEADEAAKAFGFRVCGSEALINSP